MGQQLGYFVEDRQYHLCHNWLIECGLHFLSRWPRLDLLFEYFCQNCQDYIFLSSTFVKVTKIRSSLWVLLSKYPRLHLPFKYFWQSYKDQIFLEGTFVNYVKIRSSLEYLVRISKIRSSLRVLLSIMPRLDIPFENFCQKCQYQIFLSSTFVKIAKIRSSFRVFSSYVRSQSCLLAIRATY